MSSKRFDSAAKRVEQTAYRFEDAVTLLAAMPAAKFDETVEISGSLNVDPKKGDQTVRGTVTLPHGTGKTRRVLVFCKGEQERQAREAGADHAGSAELIQKVQEGWLDFDVVIATPDMMRDVSRLGKILGPRGLMPNPKIGTVTADVARAIEDVKRGKIEFKMDKLGNLHLVIGRRSFAESKLVENGRAALTAVMRAKPSSIKGRLFKRLSLSSTMSPGIPLRSEDEETRASGES